MTWGGAIASKYRGTLDTGDLITVLCISGLVILVIGVVLLTVNNNH